MPTPPVRNQGEPPSASDMEELVRVFETGRAPNPSDQEIPSLITDIPISGHGDDLYLYEECDLDGERQENPRSDQAFEKPEGQPPKPTWRIKDTKLRDLHIDITRAQGDKKRFTWHGSALLNALNAKVGCYTWSIPEGAACPGRSLFCADCYAVKMSEGRKQATMMAARMMRLRAWALYRDLWRQEMEAECAHYGAIAPIRLHVAGDFFNEEYTRDWIAIVKATPHVTYWAYTRSWHVDRQARGGAALIRSLEDLRDLPNITLFASFDPTMPRPPKTWRWASIYGDPRAGFDGDGKPRRVMLCPEIAGTPSDWKGIREKGKPPLGKDGYPLRATCRKCGWCWYEGDMGKSGSKVQAESRDRNLTPMGPRDRVGDVSFPRHGVVVELADPGTPWPVAVPTKEEVQTYSVFRNGGGKGNRTEYSTAMAQLTREKNKAEMAAGIVENDRSHAGAFYRKEFKKLIGDAEVAARQMKGVAK